MNEFLVQKQKLHGELFIPPSKSQTLRAILFGSLAKGKTIIHHPLASKDSVAMIRACQTLGATIEMHSDAYHIEGLNGCIRGAENVINAGNSGIVLRFISAIAALSELPIVITGDHSIRHQRPMLPLLNALSQMGVQAISTKSDGFAPIIIQGPIKSGSIIVAGEDSQPVSALLIASIFSPCLVEMTVKNPGEKPFVNLNVNWLEKLGITLNRSGYEHFRISGGQTIEGFEYHVPGDLSTAAFPIAAALVTQSEITLKNVDIKDLQEDKKLFEVFKKMGAIIEYDAECHELHVRKAKSLKGVDVDINEFVDALPILAVVACFATGETVISNASVARTKECDRITAIAKELRKMGARIEEFPDGLRIVGNQSLKGAELHSHHDHRTAMSLTVASLGALTPSKIDNTECISKTYPGFLEAFNLIGANIKCRNQI